MSRIPDLGSLGKKNRWATFRLVAEGSDGLPLFCFFIVEGDKVVKSYLLHPSGEAVGVEMAAINTLTEDLDEELTAILALWRILATQHYMLAGAAANLGDAAASPGSADHRPANFDTTVSMLVEAGASTDPADADASAQEAAE